MAKGKEDTASASSAGQMLSAAASPPLEGTVVRGGLPDFDRNVLRVGDVNQAVQLVETQAGYQFDAAHPELAAHEQQANQLDLDVDQQRQLVDTAAKALEGIKPYVSCAHSSDKDDTTPKSTPLKDWERLDLFGAGALLSSMVFVMGMSAANVYANLMASMEPVFLENASIAMALAALAPCGSVAIKLLVNAFDTWRAQKAYCNIVYGLTALSFLIWVILFSVQFTGVGADLDMDDMSGSNAIGSVLVCIQLLTEILIGGVLFLAFHKIRSKYSVEFYRDNIAYINAKKVHGDERAKLDALLKTRNQLHEQLTKLRAERALHVNERIAAFVATRSRIHARNDY